MIRLTDDDLALLDAIETIRRRGGMVILPGDRVLIDGVSWDVQLSESGGLILRNGPLHRLLIFER